MRHALIALLVALCLRPATAGVFDELARLGGPQRLDGEREFLPAEQAFKLTESARDDGRLALQFDIEPGYYLYRERMQLRPLTPGLELAPLALPAGEPKIDEEFGEVEVYHDAVSFDAVVSRRPAGAGLAEAEVRYQGCAEGGICYPPIKKVVAFAPVSSARYVPTAPPRASAPVSTSDRITAELGSRSLVVTLLTFLGLGLLLALTPCVLPMVPILSGIIVGRGGTSSPARAFALSTTYVVAMAAAYALAGVVAGLLGRNLQAAFQHPAVIIAFSLVFVVLALSMFGVFELTMPAGLQSRFDRLSRAQPSGSYGGVAVMGALSAVIVGPCVAPPLAGALAYIGQSGSALTGGSALFALGIGMGLPLIALGTSAGALLPRVGAWMVGIKRTFGVIMLGVAIWFIERIVSGPVALVLWAGLAIGTATFMGALVRLERGAGAWARLNQGLGLALLLYGVVLIVGAAAGADDPVRPLAPLTGVRTASERAPAFMPVQNIEELDAMLARAATSGRGVMLDVYAEWCVECKHLEQRTFAAADIVPRLARLQVLRADVTADDAGDRALLARYGLYGPPAVLFFAGGREMRENRLVGFAEPAAFAVHLDRIEAALE